jgi:hypothetical protein
VTLFKRGHVRKALLHFGCLRAERTSKELSHQSAKTFQHRDNDQYAQGIYGNIFTCIFDISKIIALAFEEIKGLAKQHFLTAINFPSKMRTAYFKSVTIWLWVASQIIFSQEACCLVSFEPISPGL